MRRSTWPFFLSLSVAVHIAALNATGPLGGGGAATPRKVFTVVGNLSGSNLVHTIKPAAPVADVIPSSMGQAENAAISHHAQYLAPAPEKTLSFVAPQSRFYTAAEVSQPSELLLPLDAEQFSKAPLLSGRLVLDIAISDTGKVVNIAVIEASDVGGALRAYLLPMLEAAPFVPAYKDGIPVNSVRRVEFLLGRVIRDPKLDVYPPVPASFRPQMDERGNILKNQRLP